MMKFIVKTDIEISLTQSEIEDLEYLMERTLRDAEATSL